MNREATGYASCAYAMSGATVCDVGLTVGDAAQTVARAADLGASPFSQPVGLGELAIPAIRGLSGSTLLFIDEASGLSDVWSIEVEEGRHGCITGRWPNPYRPPCQDDEL